MNMYYFCNEEVSFFKGHIPSRIHIKCDLALTINVSTILGGILERSKRAVSLHETLVGRKCISIFLNLFYSNRLFFLQFRKKIMADPKVQLGAKV